MFQCERMPENSVPIAADPGADLFTVRDDERQQAVHKRCDKAYHSHDAADQTD